MFITTKPICIITEPFSFFFHVSRFPNRVANQVPFRTLGTDGGWVGAVTRKSFPPPDFTL